MLPTRFSRAVVAALALAAMACAGPTLPQATYVNVPSNFALFAFTGAPVTAPTAINFLGGATPTDASFSFDVAFDLDSTGRAMVFPVRVLAGDLALGVKRVGLQPVTGSFTSVREVPSTGYDTLSVQTVDVGKVLAVEIQSTATCLYSLGGTSLFAKMVVDSVKPAQRRLFVSTVLDGNCGYHQVMPDTIPQS
ncbi:MAG: hypothetical protein JWN53_2136 [Gemmatimonadetes bacterium]|jgi:hypothetical protein|nr:hypothetical protein [Gemmatimonadota bacterium]